MSDWALPIHKGTGAPLIEDVFLPVKHAMCTAGGLATGYQQHVGVCYTCHVCCAVVSHLHSTGGIFKGQATAGRHAQLLCCGAKHIRRWLAVSHLQVQGTHRNLDTAGWFSTAVQVKHIQREGQPHNPAVHPEDVKLDAVHPTKRL